MRQDLVEQFKSVGLTLKLRDTPFRQMARNPASELIFQMDVGRKVTGTRRTEWFEIFPGHEDNQVQILDVDDRLNQILLFVQEPMREFETEERKSRGSHGINARRIRLHEQGSKFRETNTHFIITSQTDPDKRHFLMGVDERQLFVAQLKIGVTNIIEARKQLGNTVQFHEGKRKMSAGRQGEWFFVQATKEQTQTIELLLEKNSTFIVKKANIGRYAGKPAGNPHTADELVIIPADLNIIQKAQSTKYARKNNLYKKEVPLYPIRRREVFVRGCIRHVDHKTIKYGKWYQVILNNEGATAQATQSWVD